MHTSAFNSDTNTAEGGVFDLLGRISETSDVNRDLRFPARSGRHQQEALMGFVGLVIHMAFMASAALLILLVS